MASTHVTRSITSFEDLVVYRKLVELHLEIHGLTLTFPRFELYELGSQLRRSTNSIPANIAEEWNSKHSAIYVEGISRAQGELRETRHPLSIAFQKRYLTEAMYGSLDGRFTECGKMLRSLQRSVESGAVIARPKRS